MAGVINTKRENGVTFPPDWSEIGYSDTPISTLDGFNYAKEIQENWNTGLHVYTEVYRNDLRLMYFPKMPDEKTVSMERVARMFQGSNIEYFESSLPFVQEMSSMFASCKNLRYCKITALDTPGVGINDINGLFTDCQEIRKVDIDYSTLPTSCKQAKNIFSGCWKLEEVNMSNNNFELCDGAFQNTYKMNKILFEAPFCREVSCYSMGSQTDNGTRIWFKMGSTQTYNAGHFVFENAKLNSTPYPDKATATIEVKNCNSAQSAFKGCNFICESGTNGFIIDIEAFTGNVTNCSYMFQNATTNDYFTMLVIGPVGNGNYMFDHFTFDSATPTYHKRITLTWIDFSTTTTLKYAFANSNVEELQGLENKDFSSCTDFENMFVNTDNLDDTTLNGLLKALTTASAYTGTKTLMQLGFNSTYYPASTISGLSNYTAFTAAGWSIGY